ncbi:5-formyltetrahydrofolate cyclo-ligase [Abyssibius alkaniclasticus]|uniref:5-formyltetrahydrofolate cyclo-ligase n=1 Tax=Abyssibius alkaniclasticus TaxID=2881234 RepID=UPI0040584FE5
MDDVNQAKAAARKAGFAARAAAQNAASPAAALDLAQHVLEALAGYAPCSISAYLPIRSEIDPRPAMEALHARGHRLCLPVIQGAGRALRFAAWQPGCALKDGPFGAAVPASGAWLAPDILLCPLVAFDAAFYRLGYGGGFYDRSLQALRAAKPVLAIGLAYEGQRALALPHDAHDQPLDAVATERAVYWRHLAKPAAAD